MARVRSPLRYEIDWSDSGAYDHNLSDVTPYVQAWREAHGTSRTSNPQRPTIESAHGRLVLRSEAIAQLGILTEDQLRTRHLWPHHHRRRRPVDGLGAVAHHRGHAAAGRVLSWRA